MKVLLTKLFNPLEVISVEDALSSDFFGNKTGNGEKEDGELDDDVDVTQEIANLKLDDVSSHV